jgi:transposase
VSDGAVKDITDCRRYFLEPREPRQRQYEALRAYFVENLPSAEVAKRFGYTPGSFRVLCHAFRRTAAPDFFSPPAGGRRPSSRLAQARDQAVGLRKQNHSVYEISETLKERGFDLSPTAIRQILREEGFAPLPRRLDEERPRKPGAEAQAVADVRAFELTENSFETACGGLFLFVPDLVRLGLDDVAAKSGLPGSRMIPRGHALRCALTLKLWSIERKSHVMALVADPGLALFAGLNAIPKKSYLSEYSHGIDHARTVRLLAAWRDTLWGEGLVGGESFNLDFHSVPYYGEDPVVERHYLSMRSRRQPSVLAFLAQDSASRTFCYSNADLRKGDQPEEVFRFLEFWKRRHGKLPRELVFDSKLTTYASLARLDRMGVRFITLRRRDAGLLDRIAALPRSAWRTVELDNVTRRFRTPRVHETAVTLAGCALRQLFVRDLGHEEPTILLTNHPAVTAKRLITRYAQRMIIENSISDSVRFFHCDALSSSVGMKVDFDMALLVLASGLYRLLARRMRGYADAQARRVFRDLIDMPASITTTPTQVRVHFHRRAHLPIILASGILDTGTVVPWWNNATLTFGSWGKDR